MDILSNAQQSLDEKVTLKECDNFCLAQLTSHAMYVSAASSSETLDLIEEQAKIWIKQIEQVRVENVFLYDNPEFIT